jgi:hypothetical protein
MSAAGTHFTYTGRSEAAEDDAPVLYRSSQLFRSDVESLLPGRWLTDAVVTFWAGECARPRPFDRLPSPPRSSRSSPSWAVTILAPGAARLDSDPAEVVC